MSNDIFGNGATAPAPAGLAGDFFDFDDSFKPRIPEGRSLVYVKSFEEKLNLATRAYGFFWTLVVVGNEFGEGVGEELKYYTFIGRKQPDGRVTEAEKGRATRIMLDALRLHPKYAPELIDEAGKFRLTPDAAFGRLLYVEVVHEKKVKRDSEGKDPDELTEADFWTNAAVKKVFPFDTPGAVYDGADDYGFSSDNGDIPF